LEEEKFSHGKRKFLHERITRLPKSSFEKDWILKGSQKTEHHAPRMVKLENQVKNADG
jgi:hypothetical protein